MSREWYPRFCGWWRRQFRIFMHGRLRTVSRFVRLPEPRREPMPRWLTALETGEQALCRMPSQPRLGTKRRPNAPITRFRASNYRRGGPYEAVTELCALGAVVQTAAESTIKASVSDRTPRRAANNFFERKTRQSLERYCKKPSCCP